MQFSKLVIMALACLLTLITQVSAGGYWYSCGNNALWWPYYDSDCFEADGHEITRYVFTSHCRMNVPRCFKNKLKNLLDCFLNYTSIVWH